MKDIIPNLILLLVTIGVVAIVRAQHRRGVYAPLATWWRGVSRPFRGLVLFLVLTAVAYGADKILGGHIGEGMRMLGGTVASLCTNVFTTAERQTGYAASAVHTNETHDLAMPAEGQMAERIARRGAHNDGFYFFDAYTNRLAHDGLDLGKPVWVHTDGTVTVRSPAPGLPIQELAQTAAYSNITVYAPLQSSYGFLPAGKWPDFMPSLIWTATTDRGSRVVTWEGARLDRDVARPVSFQAVFHEDGEVTYRYNPAQTNYVGIGLFRNGEVLTFGLSDLLDIQDLAGLTTNHLPLTTLHLSYIGDLGDGSGDTDDDGLTDWEEVKRYHTDPREADTDGDGLMDGYEVQNGTDPLNPDTNGDGIPDGTTPEELAANPLFATNAASANLVLSFSSPDVEAYGVLLLNNLPVPVTNGTALNLSLPSGSGVAYRFSSSVRTTMSVTTFGDDMPILVDDPAGMFGGTTCFSASGRLLAGGSLDITCANSSITGPCVHEIPGTRSYSVTLGNGEWDHWRKYAVITGENADLETFTLNVADTPSSFASLSIAFPSAYLLVGGLSASVEIHRCEAMDGAHESCTICEQGGDQPHSQGLAITPSRACLGVGTDESAIFSVTGDSYVQTPSWSLSPEVEGGPTLSANGGSATISPGTKTGVFTVTAFGECCSASATVVVYAIDYLTIESETFPTDQEIVQFSGMTPHPFNVTHSPIPDLHQPFFYKDAQTNFVVQPFTVDLIAHITPEGVTDDDVTCQWSLDPYDVEGYFENADSLITHFTPTSGGGVYSFTFTCGSLSNSEAVLVLPLSGAQIDESISNDLARADAFAAKVMSKYNPKERNSVKHGLRWFYFFGKGDYRGRPNVLKAPTVWAYNQVNTSNWSGKYALGACGTVCDLPVRLSKLSNFMVGYACEKIGVTTNNQMKSQLIGTRNDDSATTSWEAGVDVANGTSALYAISNLVYSTWGPDEKVIRLWPNPQKQTNFTLPSSFSDPDFQFTSPGFLFLQDP